MNSPANTPLAEALRPPRLGPRSSDLSDRGRELLDQLESIFINEGFASLTVGDLAARLKCSRSTLYDLAPSREELVLVVIDRRLRRIARMKQELTGEIADPADKLKMLIGSENLQLQQTGLRFMEDVDRSPAVGRLIADHLRYGVATLQAVIEEGIASGRFRAVHSQIVAETIDVGLERVRRPELLRETGLTFDEAARELTELLLSGLVVEPAPKKRATTKAQGTAKKQK